MPRSRSASSRSSEHAGGDASVMLVGHNPALEEFTAMLCGQSPTYPTAALGTLDLAIDRWDEVSPRCGTLATFVTARQLEASS